MQPGVLRILTQHRANPASTSKSEDLSGLITRHPAVLLLQDEHQSTHNRYSEQPCRTRCSTFNVSIVKLKIRPRLEPAHVQPEASETFTQHRANPASTSRSEGLRPDYTHSVFLAHHHPTARLLGIPPTPQAPLKNNPILDHDEHHHHFNNHQNPQHLSLPSN